MTPRDLIDFFEANKPDFGEVTVRTNDYTYDGWLIMVGQKRSGSIRCIIEDANGRMFIHSPSQLRARKDDQADIDITRPPPHGA